MSFKITWKTHLICIVISIFIAQALDKMIDIIVLGLFENNVLSYPSGNPGINFIILILLLMIPVSIAHELIHGTFYMAFGGRVKLGFKGVYAYCMEVSRTPISRVKFLTILLAPLTIISVISTFIGGWLGGMFFLLNALGSSGDLFMAFILIKYNKACKIVDREYGFDVIG